LRHRDGVPARHKLERAIADVRADPGAAARVRDVHRLLPRGQLLRNSSLRPLARAALVLPVLNRHGRARDHVLGVLDHDQQQLDPGANRLCLRKRRLRSQRLGQYHFQPRGLGALSAYASRIFPDRRLLRDRCWRVVSAAPQVPRRSPCHASDGLYLAAILVPIQLFFGHLNGDYVHTYQPAKFAAIEARWHDEQPAAEVLLAWPDEASEANLYEIKIPVLGSLVASMSLTSTEFGLTDFPPQDRPPVLIPFFAFRIMVGCGLIMMALAWFGSYIALKNRLEQSRLLLWCMFLSFPLPWIAILTGWFTAEVGRQPWAVYGVLRTADAMTPFLTVQQASISLVVFCLVYSFIFAFGVFYIYQLLRAGPVERLVKPPVAATPNRPLSLVDEHAHAALHKPLIASVPYQTLSA